MGIAVVTGGAGFIGRHLVAQLLARGNEVRVVDPLAADLQAHRRLRPSVGSVFDEALLSNVLTGADTVYHLAGLPQLWMPNPEDYRRVHVDGFNVLINAAMASDVRKIVVTSSEVVLKGYRDARSEPLSEPDRLPPLSAMAGPYSRSKLMADLSAMEAAGRGAPIVIVHPTLPIGPGDVGLTPPTKMILGFLRRELPAFLDSGFNFIPVEDVALGHIRAAERGVVGERYILGAENMMLSEMLTVLAEVSGVTMPKRRVPYGVANFVGHIAQFYSDQISKKPPSAPLEGVRLARAAMTFDCSKARGALGLEPTPVRDALERSVTWLRAMGYAD